MPNGFAGTSAGSVRKATEGNCCCYYWDCGRRCLGSHTEPCPQANLGFEYHTVEQHCCPRPQVDNQWVAVACGEDLVQAHRQLVAFARRRELRQEGHLRARAVG